VEEVVVTLLDDPHKFYSLTESPTQWISFMNTLS
jgi:hypothetical protein